MDVSIYKRLINHALEARKMSYSPYSEFMVGAACLSEDGRIFTGCNVENVSFGATNCAERTAIFKGVSEGCLSFKAIAIAGGKKDGEMVYCMPCGICRQVMAEFCKADEFEVIAAVNEDKYVVKTLAELMPDGFSSF